MLLIWHYENKGKERKWRNKTAEQITKEYGRKLLSEDEAFCITRLCSFALPSEQSRVFCALFQRCLQNCNASARARLLRAVRYFGWEHNTEDKGGDHGRWPSILHYSNSRPLTNPRLSLHLTQTKGCSSFWSRIQTYGNTVILSLQQGIIPCLPEAHVGLLLPHAHSLPALSSRPYGNAPRKETAPKTEHCTTTFHLCGTDQMPIMYH